MIYEFDPRKERFAIEIGVPMKLERLDKIPRPRVGEEVSMCINWNVFDWEKSFDGYGEIEREGKQIQGPSVNFPSMSFKDNKLTFGDVPGAQVGAGIAITLVINGKIDIRNPAKMATSKNKRTACGQKVNGNIIFVTVDNMTTTELAEYMLKQGCINAFQGDSGGSTGYFDGALHDQGRAVAAALVAYRREEEKLINVVVAYSQQAHNACKMGDTEQEHMQSIAKSLHAILSQDKRLNVYLVPQQNTGTDNGNLKASIALSNKFIRTNGGKGYHIELHSDAGGGKGAVGLYVSEGGKRLVSALMDDLPEVTPYENDEGRIRKRTDLGALNQTVAVAGIIEVSFHDRPDEARWVHENGTSIAVAIAHGFYKFLKGEKLI